MFKKIFLGSIEKTIFLLTILITIIAILAAIYVGSNGLLIISFILTILLLFVQKEFLSENWFYRKALIYEKIASFTDILSQKIKASTFRLLSDKSNAGYWISSIKVKGEPVIIASDPAKIGRLTSTPDEFMIINGNGLTNHKKNLNVLIGSSQCGRPYMMNVIHSEKSCISPLRELNNSGQLFAEDKYEAVHKFKGDAVYWKGKTFDEKVFLQQADLPMIKMIEVDITSLLTDPSNGTSNKAVLDSLWDVLNLVRKIRRLTKGKPIGIKLSRYYKGCLTDLCIVINNHATMPDFITISEKFSYSFLSLSGNEDKTPDDLFALATCVLREHKLNEEIRLIAEGNPKTGFDLLKSFALGVSAWFLKDKPFTKIADGQYLLEDKNAKKELLLKSCLEFMDLGGYNEFWQIDAVTIFKKNSNGNYESLDDLYIKTSKEILPGIKSSITLN